jgi:hypothetical protein
MLVRNFWLRLLIVVFALFPFHSLHGAEPAGCVAYPAAARIPVDI